MAHSSDEPETVPPTTPDEAGTAPASQLDSIVSKIESEDVAAGPPKVRPAEATTGSKTRAAAPAPRRKGGFLGLFLGGVCAAVLGFAAATYVLPRVPQAWLPFPFTDSTTQAALNAQAARIEAMAQDIASLRQVPAPVDSARFDAELARLRDEITAIPAPAAPDLGGIESRLADLDGRLNAVEKRPVAGGAASSTAIDALGRELEALRTQVAQTASGGGEDAARIAAAATEAEARIKAASDEAAKLKSEAEAIARQARVDSSLRLVQAALESGTPFGAALEDLAAAGVEIPAELQQDAGGIATLDELRVTYPDAARQALSVAVRPDAGASTLDRLGAFLRGQTGARSLSPREGSDPDAILSRAEAALNRGDLASTLAELRGLPVEVQAPMTDWIGRATQRQTAIEAAAALSAKMNRGSR